MAKRILIILVTFLFVFNFLPAQSKEIDYYSIGYNDAISRRKFNSKYSIENLSKSLKSISSKDEKQKLNNSE